jgi:hypothetical protein
MPDEGAALLLVDAKTSLTRRAWKLSGDLAQLGQTEAGIGLRGGWGRALGMRDVDLARCRQHQGVVQVAAHRDGTIHEPEGRWEVQVAVLLLDALAQMPQT